MPQSQFKKHFTNQEFKQAPSIGETQIDQFPVSEQVKNQRQSQESRTKSFLEGAKNGTKEYLASFSSNLKSFRGYTQSKWKNIALSAIVASGTFGAVNIEAKTSFANTSSKVSTEQVLDTVQNETLKNGGTYRAANNLSILQKQGKGHDTRQLFVNREMANNQKNPNLSKYMESPTINNKINSETNKYNELVNKGYTQIEAFVEVVSQTPEAQSPQAKIDIAKYKEVIANIKSGKITGEAAETAQNNVINGVSKWANINNFLWISGLIGVVGLGYVLKKQSEKNGINIKINQKIASIENEKTRLGLENITKQQKRALGKLTQEEFETHIELIKQQMVNENVGGVDIGIALSTYDLLYKESKEQLAREEKEIKEPKKQVSTEKTKNEKDLSSLRSELKHYETSLLGKLKTFVGLNEENYDEDGNPIIKESETKFGIFSKMNTKITELLNKPNQKNNAKENPQSKPEAKIPQTLEKLDIENSHTAEVLKKYSRENLIA